MSKKPEVSPPAQSQPAPPSAPLLLAGAAARVLVGLVFLGSGLHKASSAAEEFAVVVEAYRLLPQGMILPFAQVVPWLEIFLGFSLVCGFSTRRLAPAGGALLLVFIAALGSTLVRGIELANCGCFGAGVHLTAPQAMGLDSLLLLLSYLAYRSAGAYAPVDAWIERGN